MVDGHSEAKGVSGGDRPSGGSQRQKLGEGVVNDEIEALLDRGQERLADGDELLQDLQLFQAAYGLLESLAYPEEDGQVLLGCQTVHWINMMHHIHM